MVSPTRASLSRGSGGNPVNNHEAKSIDTTVSIDIAARSVDALHLQIMPHVIPPYTFDPAVVSRLRSSQYLKGSRSRGVKPEKHIVHPDASARQPVA